MRVGLQVEEFDVPAVFEELDELEVTLAHRAAGCRFSDIAGKVPEETRPIQRRRVFEGRDETHSVLHLSLGCFEPREFEQSRGDVDARDRRIALAAGLLAARPRDDEWNANSPPRRARLCRLATAACIAESRRCLT